ncbi:hypothetical protein LLG46_12820 [bacterium]|nr:hypothetical protein [bacterium]
MSVITYLLAPDGWTHEDPNPFTADGAYGPQWSCFRVQDEYDWRGGNRRYENGLFAFVVGRGWPRPLSADMADFIRYESMHGRQCIVSVPGDMDARSYVEKALSETPDWSVVRQNDQKWLVHSTTAHGWAAIQSCGELRAQARLCNEGLTINNLGNEWFDEPADYAEYILLANAGVMMPEFVVASKNIGRVITEPDTPYTPGARLFFDGHKLIRDGLIVRDGLHRKVHDHLPLDPYLAASVTPADLDPERMVSIWTPESFCLAALEHFSDIVDETVSYEHWE